MTIANPRRWLIAGVIVVIASLASWGDLDWGTLAVPGHQLFHAGGLHIYAEHPALKDGPAVVLAYAGLSRLGQDAGAAISHLAMWLAFGWALHAAGRHQPSESADPALRIRIPRVVVVIVAGLPVLTWNLPPFNAPEAALWAMSTVALGALLALPRSGAWLRGRAELSRVELFGLLMIGTWAMLAAGTAHLEDAVAIALLVWAAGEPRTSDSSIRSAVAVGVAMAFKPWAIAGVGLLLSRHRPLRMMRDLAIAGGIAACAWLPFVLLGRGLHSVSVNQLDISPASPLSLLGLGSNAATHWARSIQLVGILAAALVARPSGRYESVAAAMCVRLFLDPTVFTYYLATLLFAIGAADLAGGRGPRRLILATVGTWLVPCFITDLRVVAVVKAVTLLAVLGSYLRADIHSDFGWFLRPPRRAAPVGRPYGTSASISGVSDASVLGTPSSSAR